MSPQSSYVLVFRLQLVYFYLLLHKNICSWYSFELPQQVKAVEMSTNNKCFYEENQKNIAKVSLNTPLMKFFADLSSSVPVLAGYFTTSFSSNFEKLKHTVL